MKNGMRILRMCTMEKKEVLCKVTEAGDNSSLAPMALSCFFEFCA